VMSEVQKTLRLKAFDVVGKATVILFMIFIACQGMLPTGAYGQCDSSVSSDKGSSLGSEKSRGPGRC
jgi:hypothetical protein